MFGKLIIQELCFFLPRTWAFRGREFNYFVTFRPAVSVSRPPRSSPGPPSGPICPTAPASSSSSSSSLSSFSQSRKNPIEGKKKIRKTAKYKK